MKQWKTIKQEINSSREDRNPYRGRPSTYKVMDIALRTIANKRYAEEYHDGSSTGPDAVRELQKIAQEALDWTREVANWKRCADCGTPMDPQYDPDGTATVGNACCAAR